MNIPDYENYETKKDDLPGLARPKASACPPQFEQTATKRQASQEIQPQPPPSQFLSPEDQNQREEQRPDAAKKGKPPVSLGDLRTKEWLNVPAQVRMRFPKNEDLNIIHFSALPFKWQIFRFFAAQLRIAVPTACIVIVLPKHKKWNFCFGRRSYH